MDMKPCRSSQFREHGYDPATRTLAVRFQDGRLYHYKDVPPEKAQGLAEAESMGSYLSREIKGAGHAFEHVPEKPES